jgi:hypothetical protein
MFFGIRDPGSEIRDPGWEKPGSGIWDKHPGSATLAFLVSGPVCPIFVKSF